MAAVREHMKLSVLAGLVTLLVALNGLPSAQVECSSKTVSACVRVPVDLAESCPLHPAAVPARLGLPDDCGPGLYTVAAASARNTPPGDEVETEQQRGLQPGLRFRDCPVCPEMVVVPAGSFIMGSPPGEVGRALSEGPQHQIVIGHPFAMGVLEVTRGEFGRFAEETGHSAVGACWAWDEEQGRAIQRQDRNWRNPGFEQTERHPVVCVNWEDAQSYVGWLSEETGHTYRLSSESEWEYAARGGTATARYWGESELEQCAHANGADASTSFKWRADCHDGQARTSPAGLYTANEFGLYDTLGNVLEWVQDCWNKSYDGAPNDGRAWEDGPCERRVVRGGSWIYGPRSLRAASRGREAAAHRFINTGFRVVRPLAP